MRFLGVSIAVHVLVLLWVVADDPVTPHATTPPQPVARVEPAQPMAVDIWVAPADGGGRMPAARARVTSSARRTRTTDAWEGLSVREDHDVAVQGPGHGEGDGHGGRHGNGIGFGNGGGVATTRDVPAPPVPVEPVVSKARPAKLVWPTRDEDVDDEADLFVARITVDTDGTVVGARMIKTRPGARGDDAANAIWRFRYLPALDERGVPIRSTFEQPFQVR